MSKELHGVELIIHVNEILGESRREALIDALKSKEGIMSAEFCPPRSHLIRVSYDRDLLTSRDILHYVNNQTIHEQLFRPV